MKLRNILLIGISILLAGCAKYEVEYELMKSVFIEDKSNPGLPIYSEWGYNTFGAYIERSVFTSDRSHQPGKVIVRGDTLSLILSGSIDSYASGKAASLSFNLSGLDIENFEALLALDAGTFNLTDKKNSITLKEGESEKELEIIDGELSFKRVQKLYIDEEFSRFILSGKFQLKTFRDSEPITIYNGRFDVGIGYENFYRL